MVDSSTPLGATAGLSSANTDVPGMGVDWFHSFLPSDKKRLPNPSPDAYWEYETPLWQRQQIHERREAASVAALQAIVAEEVIADAAAVADKQKKRRQQRHEDEPPLWQRQRQHERRPMYGPHQVGRSKSCHNDEDYVQTRRRQENYAMAHNDEDCVQTRRFF